MSLQIPDLSKYSEAALKALDEPRSANEVAKMLKVNQKTAQYALLELALDGKVKHKKIGRTHVFWMVEGKKKEK